MTTQKDDGKTDVGGFKVDFKLLNSILDKGLCHGAGGVAGTPMCVEQAVAVACGLSTVNSYDAPSDAPRCTSEAIREFGIALNDSASLWRDEKHRAAVMKGFAIAQIGSRGKVRDGEFKAALAMELINRVLPKWAEMNGWGKIADRLRGAESVADAATSLDLSVDPRLETLKSCVAVGEPAHIVAGLLAMAPLTKPERFDFPQMIADCAVEVLKRLESPGAEYLDCGVNSEKKKKAKKEEASEVS